MAGAIVSRDRLLGVAPGARILAIRAFSESQTTAESTTFTILKSIEWAVSQGARVINMSFAGPYDPSLERALKDAAGKGVVLIGAVRQRRSEVAAAVARRRSERDRGDRDRLRRQGVPAAPTAGRTSRWPRRASRSSRRRRTPATRCRPAPRSPPRTSAAWWR